MKSAFQGHPWDYAGISMGNRAFQGYPWNYAECPLETGLFKDILGIMRRYLWETWDWGNE